MHVWIVYSAWEEGFTIHSIWSSEESAMVEASRVFDAIKIKEIIIDRGVGVQKIPVDRAPDDPDEYADIEEVAWLPFLDAV